MSATNHDQQVRQVHYWTGRRDVQSYLGATGDPVVYIYNDLNNDRLPVVGPDCWEIADRIVAILNSGRPTHYEENDQ